MICPVYVEHRREDEVIILHAIGVDGIYSSQMFNDEYVPYDLDIPKMPCSWNPFESSRHVVAEYSYVGRYEMLELRGEKL